ncbi:MAG: SBBP repeat-containing protein [Bryobacteraceae bacterium]
MQFLNARPGADSKPLEPLPGKTNYLVGADPKRWIRNLPTYGRIEYRNIYEGIDVAWYGNQGQLEYDFTIRPGADASRIRMSIEGARKLALNPDGGVDIETAAGAMKLRLPQIYQDAADARQPVQGGYSLEAGNVIGFKLAGYDKTRPLVIDPTLVYGSFLGTGFSINAITTDSLGDVYVAGFAGAGMPTVNALQPAATAEGGNGFVMKLNPAGTTVLYSTYFGGTTSDSGMYGIAVDSSGELAGTGFTTATDFPLVNAAWSKFDATNNQSAIALKLSADGSALVYSTYLPGAFGAAIALDGSENAYVVGDAYATAVATSGAYQTAFGGGYQDAFVAKLDKAGALSYFTFLGGSGIELGVAIAVDSLGNAYVAGYTTSVSFPRNPPGARTTNAGGYDAFIAKVSPEGSSVPWLTFLGGTGDEYIASLVRDSSSGILYIAGTTTSADLPTTEGVMQPSAHGPGQGFIASVNPDGMSFGFVTYLGGRKYEMINGMTLTPTGQLAVAGTSSSPDFATVNAIQPAFVGNGISLVASANSGGSWTADDAGLPASILALTGDPSSASTMLALSDTPLSVFRTTNGGVSWTAERLGLSYWWAGESPEFARSPANPAVVYAYLLLAEPPPPSDFVFRSTDDGVTWTSLANPPISPGDWLEGVALSATDANTLVEVFESGAVYRSTDGGTTFATLPPLLSWPCMAAWGAPVTGSPDGSIYLGTYSGICKSTDNGSTWSLLTGSGAANFFPTGIAVSPSNPSLLYAIDESGRVYVSTNAGVTWNSGTWPGGSVSMLAVAASNPKVVCAAGGGGVFVSKDGAATWTPAASLPFSPGAIAVSATDPTAVYAGGYSATDGFVAKLNTTGTSLLWSTFYTGSNGNNPDAIASVASGDVWITGNTSSTDLPITSNASSKLGPSGYYSAGFLARVSDATASCSYSLNPPSLVSYGAQSLSFGVTAPSGCAWTATPSDNSWITVPTGSGTGSGVITATLTANKTGSTRTGSVSVNGQTFSIMQADAGCTYSATTPTGVPSSGGTVEITVTASSGCPWSVVPQSPGISVVSGGSGTGNGTVTLSLSPNASVQALNPTVQVGPQTVALAVEDICSYSLSPLTLGPAAQSGSMSVTASPAGCSWSPQSDAWLWLSVSGSGTGSATFSYSLEANLSGAPRTAHITLDSRQFTVTQAGSPIPLVVGSAGGTSSFVPTFGGAWTATANDSFLHISAGSASGTGNAIVVFTYDPFPGVGSRTGTLTIAGQTVTVIQAGTNYIGPIGSSRVGLIWENQPHGVAVDGSGNVFVAFVANANNNMVEVWSPSTRQVSSLGQTVNQPSGVAVDGSDKVYIADTNNNAIEEWRSATPPVTTLVSSGLSAPYGVAADSSGNVYIADTGNNAIKEWNAATRQVSTLVASGLNQPRGVAVDGLGNVYIADTGNSAIEEWNAVTQQVTPLVSSGLSNPYGAAVDGSGNVYIADTGNSAIKEWSAATQQVTPLVSSGLNSPQGVAVDGLGNVYIADTGNNTISEVPYAFVGPASLTEPASAGTDSLLPVLPSTASLTGVFAPSSDQNWLTIGTVANGAVSFSFAANASTTRAAHISILGQQITVMQNGAQNGTAAQTITFGALSNQVFGTAPFTVSATASSGLPVSFNSLTSSVCTASGTQVTLVAVGTCIIQATQAGNATYAAATPVNQSFTIIAAGTQPTGSGVISASAFGAFLAAAPGSWVEVYGSNLASTTRLWTGADFNGNTAPTSLSGTQVTIGGQPAFLYFISPTQVNALVPSNIGTGSVQATVTYGGFTSAPVNITVNATEPGLLAPPSFKVGANQYVVAQFSDGTYVLPAGAIAGINSRPAKPAETIVIYGVGFGPVSPNIAAGQIATVATQLSASLQFSFGQTPAAQVPYDGLAPDYVGLYQFNVTVPQVPDNDLVPLTFTLGGVPGTQTLYTAVHQ